MNTTKNYLSEIIGNDYTKWHPGEWVILDAGTGCGKTFFILNILAPYAAANGKKITYLCNRSKLEQDINSKVLELNLTRTVEILTYQKWQTDIQFYGMHTRQDYLICDEAHYFTTDAMFNSYTDVARTEALSVNKKCVVIYISATNHNAFSLMKKFTHYYYYMPRQYPYVNQVVFYKTKQLAPLIDNILQIEYDSKIVVFCGYDRMQEMYERYKNQALFYCSQHTNNRRIKSICNKNAIYNNTFKGRLLFTTSALDNGIDLKDTRIKHVFSELSDLDVMVQALGRKRCLNDNDHVTFYIRQRPWNTLQSHVRHANKAIELGKEWTRNPAAFNQNHGADRSIINNNQNGKIFFAGQQSLDEWNIMLHTTRWTQFKNLKRQYEKIRDIGFEAAVMDALGDPNLNYSFAKTNDLTYIDRLKEYEARKLFKKEKAEIIALMKELGATLEYSGIRTINGILDDRCQEYPCRFTNKDPITGNQLKDRTGNKETNPNFNQSYWLLVPKTA